MNAAVELTLSHWVYLISVIVIIGTMIMRLNVVVPAVLGTFLVVWSISGSPIQGLIGIFSGSLVAAKELFDIFLVITFMTALLNALKGIGADVLMVAPFRKVMRGGFSSYVVLAAITYLISLFFWPTPAVPLVCAVLLPAAIAAGLPPLVGAMVIAIAGQGMALSSDYVIGVAPGISAKAAGAAISAQVVADKALILSLVTGLVALVIGYVMQRRKFRKPGANWLEDWELTADSGSGFSGRQPRTFRKEELAESGKEIDEVVDKTLAIRDKERKERIVQYERSKWSQFFAVVTPLAFLGVILILVLPALFPNLPALRGGDAAGLVGGVGFALMMIICFLATGPRKMLDLCPEYMIEGFVFAFKAMGAVLPIAGFFFLGSQEAAANILGVSGDTAPRLLFDLVVAAQTYIPNNPILMSFGVLFVGMMTGVDGSGFSGLPLTGSLSGALGPVVGMDVSTLAAVGQIGAIWTGGGTLIAWSSLIAVAGFARVSVLDLVRALTPPVLAGLAVAAISAAVWMA